MFGKSYFAAALLLVARGVSAGNATGGAEDVCAPWRHPWDSGPWGSLLEEWATSAPTHGSRHGRIMVLPPAQGYYVSDRIDLIPPPPPPHHNHPSHHQAQHGPMTQAGTAHHSSQHHGTTPASYQEWQVTPPPPPGAGKIVNRPPNPYKDKFKPGYPPPSPNHPIPVHGSPPSHQSSYTSIDRVDENRPQPKPQKHVSETDLYLLTAIEKLVYRVDLMEKRLRKMEENVHYLVAGTEAKPEPCAENFTRVGGGCYHFASDALNWKNANYACRKLRANLLELDTASEKRHVFANMLADDRLKGGDWWTGGLNPGLLWIWAHSAQPIITNSTGNASSSSSTIVGDGRCLALAHDAPLKTYVYRGQDCSLRHRYACEKPEEKDNLSNEIERVAKTLRQFKSRQARVHWSDED